MKKRFELTTAELNSESHSLVFMDSTSVTVLSGNTAPSGTCSTGTPSFCFRRMLNILVWTLWVSFTSSRSFTNWVNMCCPIPCSAALELLIWVEVGGLCLGVWVSVGLYIRVVGQLCLGLPVGVLAFGVRFTRLGVGRLDLGLPIGVFGLRVSEAGLIWVAVGWLDLQTSVACLSRLGNPLGLGVLLGLGFLHII